MDLDQDAQAPRVWKPRPTVLMMIYTGVPPYPQVMAFSMMLWNTLANWFYSPPSGRQSSRSQACPVGRDRVAGTVQEDDRVRHAVANGLVDPPA